MATYAWQPINSSDEPVPEQNWATPDEWDQLPLASPPVDGIVPGAGDIALLGAGSIDVSTILGSIDQAYPVTVDVTDSRVVAELGLGGAAVVGVSGLFTPVFGTPTVFPLVKVTGGTLDVSGAVVGTFVGTLSVPISGLGTVTASSSFTGGGTIDLASHATLDVGGATAAAVIVDFTDAAGDVLSLGGVTGSAPDAFAGTIEGFAQGDTLLLTALHTATHFVDAYTDGVLTIADSASPSVALATLDLPGSFVAADFGLNAGAGGLAITIAPPPPPSAPALTPASDSGISDTDDITNVTRPIFTGTAVAGSTVDLFDGAALIGTGTASSAGAWTIEANPLLQGAHAISAEDITSVGTSTASGTLTVTIDTTAPPAPSAPAFSAPGTGGTTTYNALTFTGTAEGGSIVTLFDGGKVIGTATASTGGAWSITPGTLALGAHAISADAMDIAGNTGPHSATTEVTIEATNAVHWVGGSGNFATAADWEPERVPGAGDSAIIDAPGQYTVTASANETVQTLAVAQNTTLVVSGGTFTASGGSGVGGLAGQITIDAGAALALSGTAVVAADGTISGAGQLRAGVLTVAAAGRIQTVGTGALTIASGTINNAGSVMAYNGGVTFQSGVVNQNNTGGVLLRGAWEADNGFTLSVTGGPVTVDKAAIILGGAGSEFRAGDGASFTDLEASLVTVAPIGTLDLVQRSFAATNGISVFGVIDLYGGTLTTPRLALGSIGHVRAFGTITDTRWPVYNAGTIEADDGTLAIGSAIDPSSTGVFQLDASSLLEIAADQGAGDKMSFLGGGAELMIDNAAQFGLNVGSASYTGPLIENFGATDEILLKNLAPAGLTPVYNATTGLLQISNGLTDVASLAFANASLGAGTFHITNSDGSALLTHM